MCLYNEQSEQEADFTVWEYFLRWKFLFVLLIDVMLIRYIVLHFGMRDVPIALQSRVSVITICFVTGGWFLFGLARFSQSIQKLSNSPVLENTFLENTFQENVPPLYCNGKLLGNVFSLCVATAYGAVLFWGTPLRLYEAHINYKGGKHNFVLWLLCFLVVFYLSGNYLEKEGLIRTTRKEVSAFNYRSLQISESRRPKCKISKIPKL